MSHIDRRKFLQLTGTAAVTTSLNTNIAKALAIPANYLERKLTSGVSNVMRAIALTLTGVAGSMIEPT